MSEEVSVEVLKKTQDALKRYIKRPQLTEKLLKKPPFRFLHDIITNVTNETGFLQGLYDNNEMLSENIKDRDSKIAFLQKLIDTLKIVTEEKISARPSKIIAGLEPTKTNQLLQTIGLALEKKLDSSSAVQKVTGNAPKSDRHSKLKEVEETKKRVVEEKKREKKIDESKKLVRKNTEEKLNVKKRSPRVEKDNRSTKSVERKKEAPPKQKETEALETPKQKKDRQSSQKETNEAHVTKTKESRPLKIETIEPQKQEALKNERPTEVPEEHSETSKKDEPTTDHQMKVEDPILLEEPQPKPEPQLRAPTSKQRVEKPSIDEAKNEPIELRSTTATTSVPVRAPSRQLLRPPSVRPSSARPAAPRLRERGKSAIATDLEMESTNTTSGVKVIIDHVEMGQDDEETVKVEEEVVEPPINTQIGKLPAEQGHLVKQILDQIGEDLPERPLNSLSSLDHIQDEDWRKITLSIQTLTRAANPLGKLVGYVHEDVDGMISELKNWQKQNEMLAKAVSGEMGRIKDMQRPLVQQIEKLDGEIERQRAMIHSAQANVLRNQKKIVQLLSRE